jgi:hypothetical protein
LRSTSCHENIQTSILFYNRHCFIFYHRKYISM